MTKEEILLLRRHYAREITKEEFIELFPVKLNMEYIKRELDQALINKDGLQLEYILSIVGYVDKFQELCNYYQTLLLEGWHRQHENIAMSLQFSIKCPDSVDYLIKAVELKFDYLFDMGDYEPFVTKCMYAIGDLGTDYSIQKLTELSLSEDPILAEAAKFQLDRLAEEVLQAESIDESTRDNTDPGLEGLSPEKQQKLEEMLGMDKGTLTPEMCREFDKQYIHSENKKKSTDS